ncbi:MAG: hypothetical protein D6732_00775 [Methanobacteriota archaeon]|nr:MAG: hypothetical protein D6732_00775 [Euryarchaeota archaeon]
MVASSRLGEMDVLQEELIYGNERKCERKTERKKGKVSRRREKLFFNLNNSSRKDAKRAK